MKERDEGEDPNSLDPSGYRLYSLSSLYLSILSLQINANYSSLPPASIRALGFRESRIMSRGSQRDRDRERAQARAGNKARQPKEDGLTPEQRRERDARALQEKLAKKAAQGKNNNSVANNKNKK